MPQLVLDLKRELMKALEEERFITYPEGLQKHLCDGEVSRKTYQRVHKAWNNPDFPRMEKDGIKGTNLSRLNEFLDSK